MYHEEGMTVKCLKEKVVYCNTLKKKKVHNDNIRAVCKIYMALHYELHFATGTIGCFFSYHYLFLIFMLNE